MGVGTSTLTFGAATYQRYQCHLTLISICTIIIKCTYTYVIRLYICNVKGVVCIFAYRFYGNYDRKLHTEITYGNYIRTYQPFLFCNRILTPNSLHLKTYYMSKKTRYIISITVLLQPL